MDKSFIGIIGSWVPALLTLLIGVAALVSLKKILFKRTKTVGDETPWLRQAVFACCVFIVVAVFLVSLPISESMRGQIINVLGLVITGVIALSSTTFVGNAMAGMMMKIIDAVKPGDFIKAGDHEGRISEQGFLHTEIQTEDRTLTTLPNLYLVTNPMTVVRSSGTIVSAKVSLGFDVPRTKIEKLLIKAGESVGLKDPFVQVLELGDYSVLYRVAGLLEDVKYLLSFKSKLRKAMLDELHLGGIEIVSPTFMNQRVHPTASQFIPQRDYQVKKADIANEANPEDKIFDKADDAEVKERIKTILAEVDTRTEESEKELKVFMKDAVKEGDEGFEEYGKKLAALEKKTANLKKRQESLIARIEKMEV